MKLPRDVMFYALFGTIIVVIGMAAHNLYQIEKTLDRAEQYRSQQDMYSLDWKNDN